MKKRRVILNIILLMLFLASFCRETQNTTSNRGFVSFFIIFLLTSICVVWHIYIHESEPIRISFRCLALVSESN